MASLKLSHLYKVYEGNDHFSVSDFSIDIEDQEFIVFVGPSGCGKSTTLRMIAGLESITAGDLFIGDTLVNDMEPKDRDIAMVFQSYALYPHMSVYENMAFGLRNRKMPEEEIKERVLKAAKMLDIEEYLDRKPKAMSGGQRQRVALGRALVRNPKVFLLDEPLSNLDAKLRSQMRTEITSLHKSLKTTFIYVTHDQIEAMTMGTRIVVMKDGFVQQIDTPMNLYNQPYNKFVAGFIGSPQMNFFDGVLERDNDEVIIKLNGDEIRVPYEKVCKIHNRYLNGKEKIIFGIRPEHLNINRDGKGMKFVVTNIEQLGNEMIVYGKLGDHLEEFSLKDEGNSIIVKVVDFEDLKVGEVVYAMPNENRMHFFDYESEVTLINKIPLFNTINGKIVDNKIQLLNKEIDLPPIYQKVLNQNEFEMGIAPKDIIKGNTFELPVSRIEKVDDCNLAYLKNGDSYLFALVDENVKEGTNYQFDLQNEKMDLFVGKEKVLSVVSDEECLHGRFIKQEVKEGKNRELHFYYQIGNYQVEAPLENGYKINSVDGENCYKNIYKYVFNRDAIKLADSGITGEVIDLLDYGNIRFAKVKVNDDEILIKVDKDFNQKNVSLVIDSKDISVYSTRMDMKIC